MKPLAYFEIPRNGKTMYFYDVFSGSTRFYFFDWRSSRAPFFGVLVATPS